MGKQEDVAQDDGLRLLHQLHLRGGREQGLRALLRKPRKRVRQLQVPAGQQAGRMHQQRGLRRGPLRLHTTSCASQKHLNCLRNCQEGDPLFRGF